MVFTESVKRGLWAPLVLIGRTPWLFMGSIGLLIAVAWLPSIPFTGAIFVLIPGLFVVYAIAYYHWSWSESWHRLQLHGFFMIKLMLIYAVPTLLFIASFRLIDAQAYESLMYMGAGNAVNNQWLRFCDKLPMEPALVVVFFYLFWPMIQLLVHGNERASVNQMMETSAGIFEMIPFGRWMGLMIMVLGLDVLWSLACADFGASWVTFVLAFGLLFVTVWFSGWAFLYGISRTTTEEQG